MTDTLEESIDIAASPQQVWAVVSDLSRTPEWSPQCRWMKVFGDMRVGARTLNLNRDGWKRWPTTSKVVRLEPNREIAFRITENRTVWSYQLTPSGSGTTLTERREAPDGISRVSRVGVDLALGGNDRFQTVVADGMKDSLASIKRIVEG